MQYLEETKELSKNDQNNPKEMLKVVKLSTLTPQTK